MRYVIVSDSHGYHTHLDEVLYSMGHVDGVLVLNPGSVTFPRTAEHRPTYMMMEVPSSGPVKVSLRYADES
ncbi:MAG: hypothetical protein E7277_07720 [Lachnospiraceae bacterium]|jgi:predicted phosphodiesterase|nr:hypothetical protein [Lachnospiraceae bacterium]